MKDLLMGRPRVARNSNRVSEDPAIYMSVDNEIDNLLARAASLITKRLNRVPLSSPADSRNLFVSRLANLKNEEMHVAFLDNQNRIIAIDAMFQGTIDSVTVHPRLIVRAALEHNAAAVIMAHNHPSGIAQPSASDQAITARIKNALGLIEIRLLDHIIVAGANAISMAERGLL